MPARSARTRRRANEADSDSASRDVAEAALSGASDGDRPASDGSASRTDDGSGKKGRADKRAKTAPRDGSKKAAIAAHDVRIAALEQTVAEMAERLDALTRIVDEAMKASVAPRPKATTVVPRNRPRKA